MDLFITCIRNTVSFYVNFLPLISALPYHSLHLIIPLPTTCILKVKLASLTKAVTHKITYCTAVQEELSLRSWYGLCHILVES